MSDFPPPPGDAPTPPTPPSSYPPPLPPPPADAYPPPGFGAPPPGYTPYDPNRRPLAALMAGFWVRFVALLLDGLILGVPFWILAAITGANTVTHHNFDGTTSESTQFRFGYGYTPGAPLWLNTLSTLAGLSYYGYFEGGTTGQTLGKRAMKIRVVDQETGQPGIGFGRAVGRYFARILSAIPCGLGYFWMLWDDQKQTWHDKIVRTYVTKV